MVVIWTGIICGLSSLTTSRATTNKAKPVTSVRAFLDAYSWTACQPGLVSSGKGVVTVAASVGALLRLAEIRSRDRLGSVSTPTGAEILVAEGAAAASVSDEGRRSGAFIPDRKSVV